MVKNPKKGTPSETWEVVYVRKKANCIYV